MTNDATAARLSEDLKRAYGMDAAAIRPAPRGYAAETYFVDTADCSYFLKIMNNPRRQAPFRHGLQVVDALVRLGIDYIPRVIKTASGELGFRRREAEHALFTRIPAVQSYDFDREDAFRKLARIYRASEQIPEKASFRHERFEDRFIGVYEQEVNAFMAAVPDGEEAGDVQALLLPYRGDLARCPDMARRIVADCRGQKAPFYLTHSDFPGNVLIDESGKQYLIDFDEALFGPLERDGWMTLVKDDDESALWLKIIRETFPDFEPNPSFIRYYIYERFMIDLSTFMQDLRHHPDPDHRRKVVQSTKDYLMGWLFPVLAKHSFQE